MRVEALVANVTLVRPGVEVSPVAMVGEINKPAKRLAAKLTSKRLLLSVSSGVHLQFTFRQKPHVTGAALETVLRVFPFHVVFIRTQTVQHVTAYRTFFWLAEMLVESGFNLETSTTVSALVRRLCVVPSVHMA